MLLGFSRAGPLVKEHLSHTPCCHEYGELQADPCLAPVTFTLHVQKGKSPPAVACVLLDDRCSPSQRGSADRGFGAELRQGVFSH